ncbi:MAG: 50S ribosomal protein L25 [Phycisphaerales bacterium]
MHENSPVLAATLRERTGSRYCKRIRESGGLPAVVYGRGKDPVAITLDARDAVSHIHKGEKVFELALDGGDKKQHVLLKDLQYDHLGTNIVHADLARVSLTDRVDVTVPIHYVGEAKGLKKAGAVMMHPTSELELNVTVSNIPDFIEVDVSGMDVGDSLHAGEVKLPLETMKLVSDSDTVLAHIIMKAEESESGEAAEVTAEGAQPEVIGEKKDADEDKKED